MKQGLIDAWKDFLDMQGIMSEFIGGVLVVVLSWLATTFGISSIKKWAQKEYAIASERALESIHKIYKILDDLKHDVGAQRVTVIRYHNGHKKIRPQGEIKMTVLYEEVSNGTKRIMDKFKNYTVLRGFLDHIIKVKKNGSHVGVAEEFEDVELGQLRTTGAEMFVEVYLRDFPDSFHTLSVAFDKNDITNEQLSEIHLAANQIRSLL